MGAAKSLNRLAILGLLACGGAWAQNSVTVKVGLSTPGPGFIVDGQVYNAPQYLQWTIGSTHQIYFIQSVEADGTLRNHQYPPAGGIRYTFSGWVVTGQADVGPDELILISVEPGLTEIQGRVTTEYLLAVDFSGPTDPNLPCSPTVLPNDPRQGVAAVGGTCYSSPGSQWVPPGPIALQAAAFPGFIFTNWVIGGTTVSTQSIPEYNVVGPLDIMPVFTKAKRARFRSNPLGLTLTVDHQLVQSGQVPQTPFSGDPYCPVNYSQLRLNFPVGYVPLCIGDFDFLPGSQHVLGAAPVQTDASGRTWIFSGFSNGLGQNGVYTADANTGVADTIFANFAPGMRTRVLTSPAGLNLSVDGQNNSTGPVFVWGVGETHHLVAAATQTDASGRPWKFVGWSNGASADQTYTVPAGAPDLVNLTATYEPSAKLVVDSVPSGLSFTVDGAPCTTPCVFADKTAGTQSQVVAPLWATPDDSRRFAFRSWDSGSNSNSIQVTIGDHGQLVVATFQAYYKLTASGPPSNHVSFFFSPISPDGFYADGTQVSVTAQPFNGFTFKRWAGDLSGTDPTGTVVMSAPRSVIALLNGFPFISDNGIKNGAGDTPAKTVGPGSDISIFGDDLAAAVKAAPAGQPSQAIDDVWVTVNDRMLPLFYVSPQLINAQLFSDLADGDYTLTVHRTAEKDASQKFTVRRDSPGLFQWYNSKGNPTAAALHEDGSILTADSPALANETISIFGTGFGPYDHPVVDGFPTPDGVISNVIDPVTITLNGQTYTPVSARAASGYIGMVAVRVKLTGSLPSGLVDLKVKVNNVESNTAKLPIK